MTKSEAGKLGAIKAKEIIDKEVAIRIQKYLESPIICKHDGCNNIIPYEEKRWKKFCSRRCSALFHNKDRKVFYKCKYCGISSIKGKKNDYCSSKCHKLFLWDLKKQEIENGTCNSIQPPTYKKYLEEKYGHKCSICGISDWRDKPLIMILDHIDGHSENNKIENLRLVCSNCDSQLDTYKAKNKGKGRFSRKQRFLEGKSY